MMADTPRVLYTDDKTDHLHTGKLFLEPSGDYTVTPIVSAPAALNLLKMEKFHAIISDCQVPGREGIAT